MTYRFKPRAELVWFVAVAAGAAVLQVLVDFDPANVADWRTYVVALGAAGVRAAAGAALDALRT